GEVLRRYLQGEAVFLDAARVALHADRAALQMRQHHRRNAAVVVDQIAFGDTRIGEVHLVEVADLDLMPVDLHARLSVRVRAQRTAPRAAARAPRRRWSAQSARTTRRPP